MLVEVAAGFGIGIGLSAFRLALLPVLGDRAPFALVFVAVAAATILVGWRSGLVALLSGQLLVWYSIVEPRWNFEMKAVDTGSLALALFSELALLSLIALYQREVRRAWEARDAMDRGRELVVAELNHRVKNTLAVVQSLAHHTFRKAPRSGELETFNSRLLALASAHNLLTASNWDGATLRGVVEASVEPFQSAKIVIVGPDIELPPAAAVNLMLVLSELATNASKYGSLSNREGMVRISWVQQESGQFALTWEESGGPLVSESSRRGFGTRMIEGLGGAMGGSVHVVFEPTGLICRISGLTKPSAKMFEILDVTKRRHVPSHSASKRASA